MSYNVFGGTLNLAQAAQAYRMAPTLMTSNDHEGHSPVAGLFKSNPSNICAAFYQISTDSVIARTTAGLLVFTARHC